jgi:hypothetical protein
LLAVAAAALVGLGVGIGSRIAAPRTSSSVTTVVTPSPESSGAKPGLAAPTEAGAIAAAAEAVTVLDGPALLNPSRIRRLVDRLAASSKRDVLVQAYEQGAVEARARLGADTVPAPVVILRSALLGYRLLGFSASAATVAVWRVGIVGSGATVQPQQAWRTETVSLVWEHHGWKVTSFSSAAGPTPPLPEASQASAAGDLFTEIPRFREFSRALP